MNDRRKFDGELRTNDETTRLSNTITASATVGMVGAGTDRYPVSTRTAHFADSVGDERTKPEIVIKSGFRGYRLDVAIRQLI